MDLEALIEGAVNSSGYGAKIDYQRRPFDSVEGFLKKKETGKDEWLIGVNSKIENSRRERFTLAHEIGHFFCHRKLQEEFECTRSELSDFYSGGIETEANVFAASLLMPSNKMRDFDKSSWNADCLSEMAYYFGTSLQSCGLRFQELTKKPSMFIVSEEGMVIWSKKSKSAPYSAFLKRFDELPAESKSKNNPNCKTVELSDDIWFGEQEVRESISTNIEMNLTYTCLEFI